MSTTLDEIKEMLIIINKNIEKNNEKLDIICKKLDEDISEECKKMSSHINFVESIYDTMKTPLNYICNTINNNVITNNALCNAEENIDL